MDQRMHKLGAKPGDLIEIFRGLIQHWGVYVGNDKIVHFSLIGDDKKACAKAMVGGPGEVLCEDIWKVIGDSDFKVNNHLDNKYKSRTPETIVKEALDMVGKKPRYSLFGFNCEHFATDLRYGKKESRQVRRVVQGSPPVLAVASLASVSASVSPAGGAALVSSFICASVCSSQGSSTTAISSRVSTGAVSSQSKALTRPGKLD